MQSLPGKSNCSSGARAMTREKLAHEQNVARGIQSAKAFCSSEILGGRTEIASAETGRAFPGERVEVHCSDFGAIQACGSLEEANVIPEREWKLK
jgi:hypothetical protein